MVQFGQLSALTWLNTKTDYNSPGTHELLLANFIAL